MPADPSGTKPVCVYQEDAKFRDRHDQSHGPALTQADITLPPLSPHPHWWGDGSNNACRGDSPPTLVARTSHLTPRQVPRLAYTVPRGPTGVWLHLSIVSQNGWVMTPQLLMVCQRQHTACPICYIQVCMQAVRWIKTML